MQIPTLEEVYQCLKPYGITINVELKTGFIWYEGLEEAVVTLTREMGLTDRVIYSSFNHLSIARVRELDPDAHTAILFIDVMADTVGYAQRIGVEALHPSVFHLKMRDLMNQWVNSSLKVNVWTVNEADDMKLFMKSGVNAIITNYPNLALSIRKEMER